MAIPTEHDAKQFVEEYEEKSRKLITYGTYAAARVGTRVAWQLSKGLYEWSKSRKDLKAELEKVNQTKIQISVDGDVKQESTYNHESGELRQTVDNLDQDQAKALADAIQHQAGASIESDYKNITIKLGDKVLYELKDGVVEANELPPELAQVIQQEITREASLTIETEQKPEVQEEQAIVNAIENEDVEQNLDQVFKDASPSDQELPAQSNRAQELENIQDQKQPEVELQTETSDKTAVSLRYLEAFATKDMPDRVPEEKANEFQYIQTKEDFAKYLADPSIDLSQTALSKHLEWSASEGTPAEIDHLRKEVRITSEAGRWGATVGVDVPKASAQIRKNIELQEKRVNISAPESVMTQNHGGEQTRDIPSLDEEIRTDNREWQKNNIEPTLNSERPPSIDSQSYQDEELSQQEFISPELKLESPQKQELPSTPLHEDNVGKFLKQSDHFPEAKPENRTQDAPLPPEQRNEVPLVTESDVTQQITVEVEETAAKVQQSPPQLSSGKTASDYANGLKTQVTAIASKLRSPDVLPDRKVDKLVSAIAHRGDAENGRHTKQVGDYTFSSDKTSVELSHSTRGPLYSRTPVGKTNNLQPSDHKRLKQFSSKIKQLSVARKQQAQKLSVEVSR